MNGVLEGVLRNGASLRHSTCTLTVSVVLKASTSRILSRQPTCRVINEGYLGLLRTSVLGHHIDCPFNDGNRYTPGAFRGR